MGHLSQYLFANSYFSLSPALNTASAVCTFNGQFTSCGPVGAMFGVFFGAMIAFYILLLLVIFLMIVSSWKIFKKAGQPGWASIIPIYSTVVMIHIVKKPVWWVILMFIPFVNIVVSIIIIHNLSKAFGKGIGFTVGLIVLPFIFFPILGFGKSTYLLPISPVDQGLGVPPANPVNSQTM